LHQPWRLAVAAVEVVAAALAVRYALVLWQHGVTHMVTPLGGGRPPLVSTIFYGNWMTFAIALVTVAAFVLLDGIREVLLAVRTRTRRPPPEQTAALPPAGPLVS
jgi:hypothetical protein